MYVNPQHRLTDREALFALAMIENELLPESDRSKLIEVLDHVILGRRTADRDRDYASLRELGYFYA